MAALGKSILRTHPRPAISFAAPLRRKPPPGFARQAPLTVPRRPVTYRRFNEPGPQSGTSVWASPGPSSYGGSSRFSNVSRWVPYAAGAGVVWIIFHLEQVPETGRWRYMDTSERYELEAGAQAYRQTLEQYGRQILPPNHPTSKYVGRVAERIIAASGLPRSSSSAGGESHGAGQGREGRTKVDWSIHVVDDPNIMNAFVVPGGKVFVFTGILPVCANEAGLAAVLSHEVSHQVARHTAERMSLMTVLFGLAGLAEWTFGGDFGPLYRGLLTYCLELPNSRSSEAEADHIGLDIMSRACYDPREAQKMWQRMEASQKSGGFEFMQTHPTNNHRIRNIGEWLPEAEKIREEQCGDTARAWEAFDQPRRVPL